MVIGRIRGCHPERREGSVVVFWQLTSKSRFFVAALLRMTVKLGSVSSLVEKEGTRGI
jgi:hypothetical protein